MIKLLRFFVLIVLIGQIVCQPAAGLWCAFYYVINVLYFLSNLCI